MTVPIIAGRETLGFPKIYADIEDHSIIEGDVLDRLYLERPIPWRALNLRATHKIPHQIFQFPVWNKALKVE